MTFNRAFQYKATDSKVLPEEEAAGVDESPHSGKQSLHFTQYTTGLSRMQMLKICLANDPFTPPAADDLCRLDLLGDAYFSIPLIYAYAGNTTMRQSPVVQYLLGNVTTPRSDTLYLDYVNKTVKINRAGCSAALYNEKMYGNAFLRELLGEVIASTSYNHTFFSDLELVAPVVDCTYWPISYGKNNFLRLTYVMRSTTDADDVYFLAFQLSTQDYSIPAQNRAGLAAVAMFSYFNDIRQANVPNYFAISLGYPFKELSFEAYEYLGVDDKYRWRLASIVNPSDTRHPTNL